jgi:hypothetical protein
MYEPNLETGTQKIYCMFLKKNFDENVKMIIERTLIQHLIANVSFKWKNAQK